MKVLVYGATGVQGAPVAKRLLSQGHQVRIMTRSKEKAQAWEEHHVEIAVANLDSGEGVAEASHGVDAAFIQISASIPPERILKHARTALEAATNIPHVVMTTSSIIPPHPVGLNAPDARVELRKLFFDILPHGVLLSPTLFLENFSQALRPAVLQGVLTLPVPEKTPISYISVEDQAAFAVTALNNPDLKGKFFQIAGPDTVTGAQFAEKLSEGIGQPVSYVEITPDKFSQQLSQFLPQDVATAIGEMYEYEGNEGAFLLAPPLEKTMSELPVALTPLDEWIAAQAWHAPLSW